MYFENEYRESELIMSELNDPRVLFAAERTLLSWSRTSISLLGFGFVVDRFGLFLQISGRSDIEVYQRHVSFYLGASFIILASAIAIYSVMQHRRILKTITPSEIPGGYNLRAGMLLNIAICILGVATSIYLTRSFL
jgi:putative membrane protein